MCYKRIGNRMRFSLFAGTNQPKHIYKCLVNDSPRKISFHSFFFRFSFAKIDISIISPTEWIKRLFTSALPIRIHLKDQYEMLSNDMVLLQTRSYAQHSNETKLNKMASIQPRIKQFQYQFPP